ncbi:MAG: iron-sulfur cluster insertion protein ErpA [Pelagibacteraceae bacterium]|nr:iron-sulfur cluster insertion protein ErpA [Pelagibacteraceae bacterium]|tara:strand:- start:172 stop:504 length:333 start_codon:yes stop_codon:yes gene_type:complete
MKNDINITKNATEQIKILLDKENKLNSYFRIKVNGGGCAGFQYDFSFVNDKNKDDSILIKDNVKVLIDETSLNLIQGSTIDFVNELIGASFKITNPQASSSCGCGNSFSV